MRAAHFNKIVVPLLFAWIGSACSSGAPETLDEEIRSQNGGTTAQENNEEPTEEEGEGPAPEPDVTCPDVNEPMSDKGAGLGVFVRSNSRVIATYCGSEAAATNELALSSPKLQPIAVGHETEEGRVIDLGVFVSGDELVFATTMRDTGETFYSGPASRNFDGVPHAAVTMRADGTIVVGFEDLAGGGDRDYNDIVIALTGDLEAR